MPAYSFEQGAIFVIRFLQNAVTFSVVILLGLRGFALDRARE